MPTVRADRRERQGSRAGSATSSRNGPSGWPKPRTSDRPVANHPAHRRIAARPVGVIDVLVAGEPSKYRLPQQASQQVANVLAGARIGERIGCRVGHANALPPPARKYLANWAPEGHRATSDLVSVRRTAANGASFPFALLRRRSAN